MATKRRRQRPSSARDALWPKEKHPGTGEPFVDGTIDIRSELIETIVGPPARPTRDVWDVDDNGDATLVRRMTAAEFKKAMARYEREKSAHILSSGVVRTAGPVVVSGKFRTKSGATAEGIRSGTKPKSEWIWNAWSGSS